MNEFETTLHIMMLNHVSYDDLAKQMGQNNSGNLYRTLNKNKNIYVSSLLNILDNLGYELVVREKGKTDGGYVLDSGDVLSPLRLHDMGMIFGGSQVAERLNLSRSERIKLTRELKQQIGELTLSECEDRLRDIWSTTDPVRKKIKTISEYEGEYLKYLKEFRDLYREVIP